MSLNRIGIVTEFTTGTAGTAGETACWTFNTGELWDGTSRLIICLHGHGNPSTDATNALAFNQNTGPGSAMMALARSGRYVCLSPQVSGASHWSKPAALTAITSAFTAAKARGVKTSKYGMIGWSMGDLLLANKLRRDSANIAAAWGWAGALDQDYNYSTAGHTPVAGNGSWTTEINAAFGGSTAAQFAGYNPYVDYALFRDLGVPYKKAHATDDSVIPYSRSVDFVANVNDPSITMRTPDITGDHTSLFANVPDREIVDFFDDASW